MKNKKMLLLSSDAEDGPTGYTSAGSGAPHQRRPYSICEERDFGPAVAHPCFDNNNRSARREGDWQVQALKGRGEGGQAAAKFYKKQKNILIRFAELKSLRSSTGFPPGRRMRIRGGGLSSTALPASQTRSWPRSSPWWSQSQHIQRT